MFKEEIMKKSEQYRIAQLAVLASNHIMPDDKLEIIHTLMDAEDLAKFTEERDAKEAEKKEAQDVQ